MKHEITSTDYKNWMIGLKNRFRKAQIKAAVKVNSTLLEFYWELGADIVERQKSSVWGSGFLKQLSKDLMSEFPEVKGFSYENIRYLRRWYLFYNKDVDKMGTTCSHFEHSNNVESKKSCRLNAEQVVPQLKNQIATQLVSQLEALDSANVKQLVAQIPWGQNIVIISKCNSVEEALFYVNKTIENGWSRAVLTHQIESDLFNRQGTAVTNFSKTLPEPQSDLAQQLIKDPYNFDFLTLTSDYNEKELENNLTNHITKFLMELGAGFAYMGKQVPIQVGERDFFLDLLFYHTKLHCHVVIELKVVDFEPEHAGKLNFYIKAVDEQLRQVGDNPTIGILLCKNRDKLVAEYALSDINKPMGVTEYELTQSLPEQFKSSLPTIEEIEAEIKL
jgi:predicted nuclease of restriction endonuclease-like (RecB) superfamily